jgi:hypothetical protein
MCFVLISCEKYFKGFFYCKELQIYNLLPVEQ